jgi:hypothetical protein
MEQEQLYAAVIVIGVIFSILTNVALYYYGEAKDLKRKVSKGEYLYVRGEDWIEREIRKQHEERLDRLENRMDNLVESEFNNRVALKNDLFVMRQEVDLIKFAKGVDNGGFLDRVKKLEDNMINTTYRVTKLENDDDIVRKEFLFSKLRDTDRRIYELKDKVEGKGVSDDKA